jgi:hypothetical protein
MITDGSWLRRRWRRSLAIARFLVMWAQRTVLRHMSWRHSYGKNHFVWMLMQARSMFRCKVKVFMTLKECAASFTVNGA